MTATARKDAATASSSTRSGLASSKKLAAAYGKVPRSFVQSSAAGSPPRVKRRRLGRPHPEAVQPLLQDGELGDGRLGADLVTHDVVLGRASRGQLLRRHHSRRLCVVVVEELVRDETLSDVVQRAEISQRVAVPSASGASVDDRLQARAAIEPLSSHGQKVPA